MIEFDEQRRIDNRHAARVGGFEARELAIDRREQRRVHQGIEPRQFIGVGKDDGGEGGPRDAAIGRENLAAEFAHHFFVGRAAGRNHLMAERVGFQNMAAEFAHHGGHGAFAAADSSGESDAQHQMSPVLTGVLAGAV